MDCIQKLEIVDLAYTGCFYTWNNKHVDDLLIFSAATIKSAQSIKVILAEFAGISGLIANLNKSSVFCSGVDDLEKKILVSCLQIKEAKLLPVRYLGVP